jgi:hypothetical protein
VRQYAFLAIDAGPARVRRLLEQMVVAEAATPTSSKETT